MAADPIREEFNLEPYARTAEAVRLSGRTLALAFSTFLVLTVIYGTARLLYDRSFQWYEAGIFAFALLVAAYGFRVAFRLLGPGATSLEIDSLEVRFIYRSGKVRNLLWSDQRFELHLRDYRQWTRARGGGPDRALLFAQAPGEPRAALSPEAFDAILDAARSHGLAVTGKSVLLELFEKRREITIRAPAPLV